MRPLPGWRSALAGLALFLSMAACGAFDGGPVIAAREHGLDPASVAVAGDQIAFAVQRCGEEAALFMLNRVGGTWEVDEYLWFRTHPVIPSFGQSSIGIDRDLPDRVIVYGWMPEGTARVVFERQFDGGHVVDGAFVAAVWADVGEDVGAWQAQDAEGEAVASGDRLPDHSVTTDIAPQLCR